MSNPGAYLHVAHALADAAQNVILPHFRTRLDIDDKADASPVTLADRGAELAMREILSRMLPEHGIIGEEFGSERADAEWVWVLDPVDGTKSFVCGRPTFCTLIGLLHFGQPVMGMINQPVLKERWVGITGETTSLNGQAVSTTEVNDIAHVRLGSTGPQYFSEDALPSFNRIAEKSRFTLWGGDAYLYAQLASGGLEVVIESGLKLHDFAALAPVVIGAGGVMTDWQGKPLHRDSVGQVVASANAALHDGVLALMGV